MNSPQNYKPASEIVPGHGRHDEPAGRRCHDVLTLPAMSASKSDNAPHNIEVRCRETGQKILGATSDSGPSDADVLGPPTRDDLELLEMLKLEYSDSRKKLFFDCEFLRYGSLPAEDSISGYVRKLFGRICADASIELVILEGGYEPLAYATFHRKIVINKKMLEFCRSEEELLFILHHELKHIQNNHFIRSGRDKEPTSLAKAIIREAGDGRIREVIEADMESLADLDQKGVNIAGAFSLFERFDQQDKKLNRKGDSAHGSMEERLIAIKGLLQMRDFKNYVSEKQTPLDASVINAETLADTFGFPLWREMVDVDKKYEIRRKRIETLGERQLYLLGLDLSEMLERIKRRSNEAGFAQYGHYFEIKSSLLARMDELLISACEQKRGVLPDHTRALLAFMRKIFSFYARKIPYFPENDKSKRNYFKAIRNEMLDILGNNDLRQSLASLAASGSLEHYRGLLGCHFKCPANEVPLLPKYFEQLGEKMSQLALPAEEQHALQELLGFILEECGYSKATPAKSKKSDVPLEESADFLTENDILEITAIAGNFEAVLLSKAALKKEDVSSYLSIEYRDSSVAIQQGITSNRSKMSAAGLAAIRSLLNTERRLTTALCKKILAGMQSPGRTSFERELCLRIIIILFRHFDFPDRNPDTDKILQKIHALTDGFEAVRKLIQHETDDNMSALYKADMIGAYLPVFRNKPVAAVIEYLKSVQADLQLNEHDVGLIIARWLAGNFPGQFCAIDDFEHLLQTFGDAVFAKVFSDKKAEFRQTNYEILLVKLYGLCGKLDKVDVTAVKRIAVLLQKLGCAALPHDTFYRLLAGREWEMTSPDECYALLHLCGFFRDSVKRSQLEKKIWRKIMDLAERQGKGIGHIFEELPHGIRIPMEIFEQISEFKATAADDIETCKKYATDLAHDSIAIGKLVLGNSLFDDLFQENKKRLLLALLNPDSDLELKEVIFDTWHSIISYAMEGEVEDDYRQIRDMNASPDEFLQKLNALDDYQRFALIHSLLLGEGGVLSDRKAILEILDMFFENFVSNEGDDADKAFVSEAKKIIAIAIEHTKPTDLYFLLSKLLSQRILKAPYKDNWLKLKGAQEFREGLYSKIASENGVNSLFRQLVYGYRKPAAAAAINATQYLFDQDDRAPAEKLDALGLLLEIAESMGSIGIRFLQMMGLYIDVPERYRDAFKKVYSEVQGQFKITAYDTLREHLPEAQQNNMRLGPRLGGGSILMAYPFETDELKGVVKIVNPNILTQMERTFAVLEKTFQVLAEENRQKYGPLQFLLQDIKQWVLADVDLAQSQELDSDFRAQNEGFTIASGKFHSAVPNVHAYHPKYVVEERVEGKHLHSMENEPEEMRDIFNLIRQQILYQIAQGVVHSDVHGGNFLIDEKDRIHWLDRTLLLRLSPEEQDILMTSLLQPSEHEMLETFLKRVLELPVNQHLSAEEKDEILQFFESPEYSQMSGFLEKVKAVLVYLRKQGVTIPFNLAMTIKNLVAIEMMRRPGR